MNNDSQIVLHGPLFVSTKKVDDEWHCTALLFDILGIGATEIEAFEQMKELLEIYLEDVAVELHAGNDVGFFNPSESREWNDGNIDLYRVVFELNRHDATSQHELAISELGRIANNIRTVSLEPVGRSVA